MACLESIFIRGMNRVGINALFGVCKLILMFGFDTYKIRF